MIRDEASKRAALDTARTIIREHNREKNRQAKAKQREREKAVGQRAAGQRQPRVKDPAYLNFIRRQPCCVCGAPAPSQAAHIRSGYPEAGWRPTGMQERPDDHRALPLCAWDHLNGPEAQHRGNETAFWRRHNIYPPSLCASYRRQFEGDEA